MSAKNTVNFLTEMITRRLVGSMQHISSNKQPVVQYKYFFAQGSTAEFQAPDERFDGKSLFISLL